MLRGFARRQLSGGLLFGPVLVGLVYGFALTAVPGFRPGLLSLQGPFTFTVLSGVAIAFACRPVLNRIGWSRPVAMALGVALLVGIGPLGDWAVSGLIVGAGLGALPLNLPPAGQGLLLGAVLAGVLMGWLFGPRGGALDAPALWARWRFEPASRRLGRLALVSAAAVALWLGLSALDARLEESAAQLYVPLAEPNYWLRLQGLWAAGGVVTGAGTAAGLLGLLWLRGVLTVLPLLPIALAVRGTWGQLTLVFTLLLFVLGEFAPLMADQPYPSLRWLLARVGLGLLRAAVLGGLTAALFGVLRRDVPGGAEAEMGVGE
jgi:hypothetical protein